MVAYGGDAEPVVEPASIKISSSGTIGNMGMESVDAAIVTSDDVVVEEFLLSDSGHCTTTPPKPKKTLFTPRAKGKFNFPIYYWILFNYIY